MYASKITTGCTINGRRIMSIGTAVESGRTVRVFRLEGGGRKSANTAGWVAGAARPGSIILPAGQVRPPTRTEMKAGIRERQGGEYIGVVTTRRV